MGPESSNRDWRIDVRRSVEQTVATLTAGGVGNPNIQRVAAALGTSVRTLQRRLRADGLTYAAVLGRVRCANALAMLASERRVVDVARALGYSDPAHFTRAFQRWTGVTPREFRRRG